MATLDSKVPEGPIKDKWTTYKDKINLVNPANKRNIDIIIVGILLQHKVELMQQRTIRAMAIQHTGYFMIL